LDAAFSTRIRGNFFASRNTKPALITVLTALGATVQVFEPWNPADMGALGQPSTLAYNVAGLRGSYTMTGQCFVIVTLPAGSTVTPSQVYAAVESVRPLAIKVWTKIVSA
jgi:hypothetical protein